MSAALKKQPNISNSIEKGPPKQEELLDCFERARFNCTIAMKQIMRQRKNTKRTKRRKNKPDALQLKLNECKSKPDMSNIKHKEVKPDQTKVED